MDSKQKYIDAAVGFAKKYDIDPAFFVGLINSESSFNPNALNTTTGAFGFGQFLPSTAKDEGFDIRDPMANLEHAAKYFKSRLYKMGGDYDKAAALYKGAGRWDSRNKRYTVSREAAQKWGDVVRAKMIPGVEKKKECSTD